MSKHVTLRYKPLQTVTNLLESKQMKTTHMTEMDAERWTTIARLHAESGVSEADDFWLEGIDELCSAFQPNKCDGCPVKSFTGRANCAGAWHWYLWVDTVDAYLALKNEN